jgi:hypothetical protein
VKEIGIAYFVVQSPIGTQYIVVSAAIRSQGDTPERKRLCPEFTSHDRMRRSQGNMELSGGAAGTPERKERPSKDGPYLRPLSPAKPMSCIAQLIMALVVSANLEIFG